MIKHIVMWNVRGETHQQRDLAIANLKQRFEALEGQIPGLLRLEIGVDISRIDYACDVVLYSEFENEASLAAYAVHPAHLKVKNELWGVRVARYQVDYLV